MKKIIGVGLLALMIISCNNHKKKVQWIASTQQQQWKTISIEENKSSELSDSAILIFPEKEQQQIDGFGGCFNELGWEALNLLTEAEKDKLIQSFFDTIDGCKFNICRMPIGANDYAVDWYSHNEFADDFEMEHFSIQRDKERLIPYINYAKKYNPELKIWASPWCPPSWMKTNNHYACRPAVVNDLSEEGRGVEKDAMPVEPLFRMEKEYLSAYALYFSKFINAYKNEGIDIYAVHVQNEPNSCQNFPSCIWTPSSLATFIGDYLGPQFTEDEVESEIWLGTIERPQIERIDAIVQQPEARKYIKGIGFQWGGKGAIADAHKKYPEYKLMQTETQCGNGSNDWAAAEETFGLLAHYFNKGANSYMYWNMVLNETGKSQWGWKQNSMVTIDTQSKEISYNPEYYLMKHFSHFIEPGSFKVESSQENCLAFKKSNRLIITYYNSGRAIDKQFVINDLKFEVRLAEKSFNTFVVEFF